MTRFTAKVKITEITPQGDQARVKFGPNYDDNPGNAEWAKYTPWLEYTKNIRGELVDKLHVGQTFTVLFAADEEVSEQASQPSDEPTGQQGQVEDARDTEQAPPEAFGQADAQAKMEGTTDR